MPSVVIYPAAVLLDAALRPLREMRERISMQFAAAIPRVDISANISQFLERHQDQIRAIAEGFELIRQQALPPNWRDLELPDLEVIYAIAHDEGLPLVGIPSSTTMRLLLAAADAPARRRIISRRWIEITDDCRRELLTIVRPELQKYVEFANSSVAAMEDGHYRPAQALAANLLDTILRETFESDLRTIVMKHPRAGGTFDMEDFSIRVAFTLAPIWRAHKEFRTSMGDQIPHVYGRHPSVHAVSSRQYSRINAVISLMLVTSLLRLLHSDAFN
jgi:hypothetical protein